MTPLADLNTPSSPTLYFPGRIPIRGWWIGGLMGGLLLLLTLLVFGDVHRRHNEALEDFTVEQKAHANGLAMGLRAQLDSVRSAVLWAVERGDCQTNIRPSPNDPVLGLHVADSPPPSRAVADGQIPLSLAIDENRRAYFSISLQSLRSRLRELDRPGNVRMLLLPPGADMFQTLNGRSVPSSLLLKGLHDPQHHIRIPTDVAESFRLPPGDALAGLAEIDAGDMGIWAVAVVATARRALDREAQASWRSLVAIVGSAGLVLLLMRILAFGQRRELRIEKALELEAAHRRQEEVLERANRAATLGALAIGIAHELSTPLGVIATRADQLRTFPNNQDLIRKSANVISEQTTRIERVMRGIIGLVRGQSPSESKFSAVAIARHAAELVAHRFSAAHVELHLKMEAQMPDIRGDQHLLEHAVVNLLLNACDACDPDGVVELEATTAEESVAFTVRDNGGGISEEVARHVMEPFFTTKPQGQGSGLGLAIAQEIIKSHRGTLTLMPREGGGTTAVARIPIQKGNLS